MSGLSSAVRCSWAVFPAWWPVAGRGSSDNDYLPVQPLARPVERHRGLARLSRSICLRVPTVWRRGRRRRERFRQCCRVVGLGNASGSAGFGGFVSVGGSSGFAGFSFGGSSGFTESPAR